MHGHTNCEHLSHTDLGENHFLVCQILRLSQGRERKLLAKQLATLAGIDVTVDMSIELPDRAAFYEFSGQVSNVLRVAPLVDYLVFKDNRELLAALLTRKDVEEVVSYVHLLLRPAPFRKTQKMHFSKCGLARYSSFPFTIVSDQCSFTHARGEETGVPQDARHDRRLQHEVRGKFKIVLTKCNSTSWQKIVCSYLRSRAYWNPIATGSYVLLCNILPFSFRKHHGLAAFLQAVRLDSLESAKILIEGGLDVRLFQYCSPMCKSQNILNVVCTQVNASYDEESPGPHRDTTPLMAASNNPEITTMLLTKGADPTLCIRQTALHLAAYDGNTECVKLLLDAGADVNAMDNMEQTPLHNAAKRGHAKVYALLISRGADKKVKSWIGETPQGIILRRRTPLEKIRNGLAHVKESVLRSSRKPNK